MAKDRRCDVPGCGGWRIRGSDKCAGHDPEAQERSRAAVQEKAQGLALPPLREPADAEAWIAAVGQLLASGKIKEVLAHELRMVGKDWAAVHQGRLASQEFEALKHKVAELAGAQTRPLPGLHGSGVTWPGLRVRTAPCRPGAIPG